MAGQFGSFVTLARAFVEGRLSASEFEMIFLSVFRGEGDVFSEVRTRELHKLFSDVDAYCDDPEMRDAGDLNDSDLLVSARAFLEAVQDI